MQIKTIAAAQSKTNMMEVLPQYSKIKVENTHFLQCDSRRVQRRAF